mgnify:FL=1|tara:strand:+ start:327 stop:794 length:468 start_codon:yes stop_codon:yes gene_type:complete
MKKFIIAFLISVASISFADEKNIIDSISDNNRLQKLNEFVTKSELSKNLLDYDTLTLFAPLDDAFAALSAKTYYGYLNEKNRDKLQRLVNYHFVEGIYGNENIEDVITTKSINGLDLEIKKINGILYVNGAEVVEANIKFSNGIIHLTNRVLIPK